MDKRLRNAERDYITSGSLEDLERLEHLDVMRTSDAVREARHSALLNLARVLDTYATKVSCRVPIDHPLASEVRVQWMFSLDHFIDDGVEVPRRATVKLGNGMMACPHCAETLQLAAAEQEQRFDDSLMFNANYWGDLHADGEDLVFNRDYLRSVGMLDNEDCDEEDDDYEGDIT